MSSMLARLRGGEGKGCNITGGRKKSKGFEKTGAGIERLGVGKAECTLFSLRQEHSYIILISDGNICI